MSVGCMACGRQVDPAATVCPSCGVMLPAMLKSSRPPPDPAAAATHHDLAAAYHEMGLSADAIAELELAAMDPARQCACQTMIGKIHRDMGDDRAAVDALLHGLDAWPHTAAEEIALLYELGDTYAALGLPDEARQHFRRVVRLDPDHADPRGPAAARLRALGDDEPPDDVA